MEARQTVMSLYHSRTFLARSTNSEVFISSCATRRNFRARWRKMGCGVQFPVQPGAVEMGKILNKSKL